jgi:hypothetical protein
MTTTEDLIQQNFTTEEALELKKEIQEEVEEIKWGGKRKGAGRKPVNGVVLEFKINVSKQEKEFIKYARKHHLNYEELMQG